MPDYSKTKIYMIVPTCTYTEGEIYIGSTCLPLSARMAGHRKKCNKCSSKYLFNKYGIDNCKIELIENFPCNNIEESNKKEAEHIRARKCINKQIPGRTITEWYSDNIVTITAKKSIKIFCECGGVHRKDNKVHHVNTDKHIKYIYDKTNNFNFIDLSKYGVITIGLELENYAVDFFDLDTGVCPY
jgi:hypothetical protein